MTKQIHLSNIRTYYKVTLIGTVVLGKELIHMSIEQRSSKLHVYGNLVCNKMGKICTIREMVRKTDYNPILHAQKIFTLTRPKKI